MAPAIPAAATAAGGTPAASNARGHKRTPSPSRRRDLPAAATTRPPLFPAAEKDNNNSAGNAAVLRRPRSKEISSRYLSSSSPSTKCGSFGSPSSSTGSSSSKGGSFTTSSCSTTSSSSSGTSSSSGRRFPSPISTPRPSTPPALSQNSVPRRSKSVDRTRAATPAVAAPRVAELSSSAARTLCTASKTTRSLSVSFQGESFSYQTSKTRPTSPSQNRKPTPERRKPAPPPSATPARGIARSESSRTFDSHHRWPAARNQQPNPLAKSLDCSLGNKDSILAAVRLLRQSMVLDDSARRASFDGSDLSVSSCTDSSSSESSVPSSKGQATPRGITARFSKERSSRLHRSPEVVTPLALGSKSVASSKLDPARKSLDNSSIFSLSMASSPRYGSVRPSSPSRLVANSPRGMSSPQRLRNNPATSNSRVPQSSSAYSVASFHAEAKRGRNGENRIEDAHQLRLFYNRVLQWRWANAQASDALFVQELIAEKHLYNAWINTAKLHESITMKKLKLLMEKRYMKLGSVFKGQMIYLEEWALIERDHTNSVPGTIEALKSSTVCLPVVDGAKADFQEMRNAVGSAVDVMQAIGTSICSVLSKVERRSSIVTELVKLAKQEQALMHQCRDLLSIVAAMHVKQCSLLGHITQLRSRPSLIQL